MLDFILSIIGTISLLSLLTYDFLCICRIIKKEEVVKAIWTRLFKDKEYNEKKIFLFIRPILLQISFITYVLSLGVLSKIPIFNLLLCSAPILAAVTAIVNIRKE